MAERKTYTFGCTPVQEIEKRLPAKYPMELTRSNMIALLYALEGYAMEENGTEFPEIAWSLRTGILETLNIEEV